MSISLVTPSSHLILCHPLLLPPSIFPSIMVFCNESVLRIRWPKYWSFSFSISPSNEYPGLISFLMDWLDPLAVTAYVLHIYICFKIRSFASPCCCCCLVTKSCLTLCDPHGLQYTRLPCPSPSPGVCSNSCPLSQWCHPTISFSVIHFSSCPQSSPASVSFPMSQPFTSGGQSIGCHRTKFFPLEGAIAPFWECLL